MMNKRISEIELIPNYDEDGLRDVTLHIEYSDGTGGSDGIPAVFISADECERAYQKRLKAAYMGIWGDLGGAPARVARAGGTAAGVGEDGMNSNRWLDFATGGAIALWTLGPIMFVIGLNWGHVELVVMGPLCFLVGAWILCDGARR